ncbi:MAG TPA: hypothetical protein VE975_03195 [Actinomycetota bacterium]|jgi:endogenous inhibitor of DNA gyrase (YacG/DUF329 family)|nr:hypothetical protein [Actinomycetota bacterium]
MDEMAPERCPDCGTDLSPALGQHAMTPSAGIVQCPSCGRSVQLSRQPVARPEEESRASQEVPRADESVGGEEGKEESFSGGESADEVMEELKGKPGGPKGQR